MRSRDWLSTQPRPLCRMKSSGIHNLYRIITASNLDYYDENPLIPASILKKYSDGLLVGAPFLEGEISAAVTEGTDDEIIQKIADKYDFIEIIPMPEEKNLARKLYDLAGRINRPVVAASKGRGSEGRHFWIGQSSLLRVLG